MKDINTIPVFTDIKFWVKGFPYSIPAKKTMKITKTFTFDLDTPALETHKLKPQTVQLAGDFNNWNPSLTNLEL